MNDVSDNARAILLLTAPLTVSTKAEPASILSLGEYNRLARALHTSGLQPQDLLGEEAGAIISGLPSTLEPTRLHGLLERGFLLGQAVAEWQRRSIWVVSRADSSYPKLLRSRLREQAPPILYGCGDPGLLENGGLAVVGSRTVSEELKHYAGNIGAMAADANVAIISGAARGIDSSVMQGALQNGGTVVGVMADSLARASVAKSNREALQQGKLVVTSAYDPSAGFNVGHAMQRNKAIYALADAALVVTSDFNRGGTWAGAIEQLEKLKYVPVFIRSGDNSGEGNEALIHRGGRPWPEPGNGRELQEVIAGAMREERSGAGGEQLELRVNGRDGEASQP